MGAVGSDRKFAYNLWKRYRLTVDEYEDLRRRQDDRCAGCGFNGKLVVDHDHSTGDIRGLLCMSCNLAVGQLRSNIVHLESLIAYLNKPAVLSGADLQERPRHLVRYLKQLVGTLEARISSLKDQGREISDSGG